MVGPLLQGVDEILALGPEKVEAVCLRSFQVG